MENKDRILKMCRGIVWWTDERGKADLRRDQLYYNEADRNLNKLIENLKKILPEEKTT